MAVLGQVLKGAVPMIQPQLSGEFATIMQWADKARRMKVRANADNPADARVARMFGAEGIGLCRTEQMFFDEERIICHARDDHCRNAKPSAAPRLPGCCRSRRANFVELFEMMAGPAGHHPPAGSAAA